MTTTTATLTIRVATTFFHNRGAVYDPADLNTERHGTHVAGIIGAVGNNGFDMVGVN